MSFSFQDAKRTGVHIILGLMGGTGSGKTWSALELATGLAGDQPFAFIDTEAGRALQYADYFKFQHGELRPPFTPAAYLEAIVAAEKAGFPVVVVDSMTHEHAGDGGILDMHDVEHKRLGGRDNTKMLAWVKPKGQPKKMVARLLQLRTHLILCFRAEPKLKMVSGFEMQREKLVRVPGKTAIVDMGWQPIAAKGLEFEMAASWMLRNETPGQVAEHSDEMHPSGTALKMPEPLKKIFSGSYQLNRKHGEELARWAAGDPAPGKSTERSIPDMVAEDYIDTERVMKNGGKRMMKSDAWRLLKDEGLVVKSTSGKHVFADGASHAEVRMVLDGALRRAP